MISQAKLAAALIFSLAAGGCLNSANKRVEAISPSPSPTPPEKSNAAQTVDNAEKIVTQPARDVGVSEIKVPDILVAASLNPYSIEGTKNCRQLVATLGGLNEVLGPDYVAGTETKENRAGKLAEAGGKTVVNALIPFRALVRELSGAAPAQRRLDDAIEAGFARRGFIRGIRSARGCRA